MQNNKNRLAAGFLASVSNYPSRHALVINDESYTYDRLLQVAVNIAGLLQGQVFNQRVAIYCTHSAVTYATVLAVTLRGASYVPLNPTFPRLRLQEIIDLSGVNILLAENEAEINALGLKCSRQIITATSEKVAVPGTLSPEGDEAYLLFTSGSTGKPKGVPVSHKNLQGFFEYFSRFRFTCEDRFIQPFDLSFDMSVMMMFLCWNAGACLYPVSPSGHKPFNVLSALRDHAITVCAMVPSLITYIDKYLNEVNLFSINYTFFAGERLSVDHARKWQAACVSSKIFNAYGPSEATIVCMAHEFNSESVPSTEVPIGKPFEGTHVILVDETMCRQNDAGEICLCGGQVIDHYLDRQDEERFVVVDGRRFYRTGDLGYFDEKNDLVFSGRVDRQIKVNGYRVEPLEISRAIRILTGTASEILLVERNGEPRLVAFVQGEELNPNLNRDLESLLPPYMVPSVFVWIKEIPTGTHDKVDQKRLLQLYDERNHA